MANTTASLDRSRRNGTVAEAAQAQLRLQTSVRLRWFAVAGQLIAIGLVSLGLGFSLPVGTCLLLIAMSAWVNIFLRVRFPARHRLGVAFATTLLLYDLLQLAGLLYLTGGINNPFVFLMVVPVTVSAATLPPRTTVVLAAIAGTIVALLVRYHLPLPWSTAEGLQLPLFYQLGMVAAVYASMTFLPFYAWRLASESRQMSTALAATELVLAREQQLHALDGMAAAAAHELGTPLATIVLISKEIENELASGAAALTPFAEDLTLLRSQALRCRDILQKLTRHPSEPDPLHTSLSVTQLIDEAAAPYRRLKTRIAIAVARGTSASGATLPEPLGERRPGMIFGLGNLIENACSYAVGEVTISTRWSDTEIEIDIADDGPGFAPEIIESLGEPFVTTRSRRSGEGSSPPVPEARSGLGLGLFIARILLERSGARLEFGNRWGGPGALVRVIWPRSAFVGNLKAIGSPG
jgi:two-component system sensor histidine kinase RegB